MAKDTLTADAYSSAQVAIRVENACITKVNRHWLATLMLAILAGVFISFGALLYTFVIHDSSFSLGMTRLIGGLGFCLGLILVVIAGAELFTGNNLMTIACLSKKISPGQLWRNWLLVFCGNFIGALLTVTLIFFSHYWQVNDSKVGAITIMIAQSKIDLSFSEAFVRGILCNMLVCLAVWLCFAGRSVSDKILAILFPITGFVALGFEHSVANMYFIPAGIMAMIDPTVTAALPPGIDPQPIHIGDFLLYNLLPVTLGNMVGGGLFIGLPYWLVHRKSSKPMQKE